MASQVRLEVEVRDAAVVPSGRERGPVGHQQAWVDLGQAYPFSVRLPVWRDGKPLPVGRYVLGLDGVVVDRWGELKVTLGKLKSAVPQPAAVAGKPA